MTENDAGRDGPRNPFEQLERSHRRLEERLADLAFTAREAKETGRADAVGVREVAAFFARAVRRHEDDEERSLFPRLAGHEELRASTEKLTREHREHEALHAALDRVVGVLDGAPEDAAAIDELTRLSGALEEAYRGHIEHEEKTLFPAALASLDADALQAIGREMDERRGGGGRGRGGGGGVRAGR